MEAVENKKQKKISKQKGASENLIGSIAEKLNTALEKSDPLGYLQASMALTRHHPDIDHNSLLTTSNRLIVEKANQNAPGEPFAVLRLAEHLAEKQPEMTIELCTFIIEANESSDEEKLAAYKLRSNIYGERNDQVNELADLRKALSLTKDFESKYYLSEAIRALESFILVSPQIDGLIEGLKGYTEGLVQEQGRNNKNSGGQSKQKTTKASKKT